MQFAGGELVLQCLIDALLALDAALAFEFGADDDGVEMLAVAVKFEELAGHAGKDELLDMVGMHGFQALSFQPDFNRCRVTRDTTAKQAATTSRLVCGGTSETPKKP